MRRNDREITDFDELIKVMEKCDVCRLAIMDDEYPYILPLNFGMKKEAEKVTLYFHGALEGKKYKLLEKNNKVGFEMDCSHRFVANKETCNCTMEYESIMGFGVMEEVPPEEKYDGLCILMGHYPVGEDFKFNQKMMMITRVFKMTVLGMTGKARKKSKQD